MNIIIGTKAFAGTKVTKDNTAEQMGSGSLPVFATPAMAALMEKASCLALEKFLEEGQTSVGTSLNLSHLSATPVGMTVTAVSEITEVSGRKVSFSVTASDGAGEIGTGTHERVIVDAERFLSKTSKKLL